jgi:hypothetical protein
MLLAVKALLGMKAAFCSSLTAVETENILQATNYIQRLRVAV